MASAGASGKSTVTPSANRLLQRKWDERKYREHQDRVITRVYTAQQSVNYPYLQVSTSPTLFVLKYFHIICLQLRRIKPSVDNGLPRNFMHIKQNLRKQRVSDS